MRYRLGSAVRVVFEDGSTAAGQVWSHTGLPGRVWVALDNGEYVVVSARSGVVRRTPTGERVARVAA